MLGDSAGMGKGRTLAGFVAENISRGRKRHVWISVSNDLYHDACRDLKVRSYSFEHQSSLYFNRLFLILTLYSFTLFEGSRNRGSVPQEMFQS